MTTEQILRQIFYIEGYLDAHELLFKEDGNVTDFIANASQMLFDLRTKITESHKTHE